MRLACLLLAACACSLAVPAAAQRLGARTQSPAEMARGLEQSGGYEEEMGAIAAAAAAHPLGSIANPVRVGGPEGARAYLARLRCPGGAAPELGARRDDAGTGPYGSVLAAWEARCGATGATLAFDFYHAEHVEAAAPPGFTLQR